MFIQLTVHNMLIVQCMHFHSSYDEESYNEHEFMYHDFYTIAWMKICVNDHNTSEHV